MFLRKTVAMVALVLTGVVALYFFFRIPVFSKEGFLSAVVRATLFDLVNVDRGAYGLPTLSEDPHLDQAAQAKANDMAAGGYFAHVSPDGKTPWYWLDAMNYPYVYAGENLAVNFDESKDVEAAWMQSPAHRANLLKPEYARIGFGIATGTYQGREAMFVVQMFASIASELLKYTVGGIR